MSRFSNASCKKNSRQAPQGIPLPPPLGALSRKAISRFTTVCPLFTYIFSAATRSAHRSSTPEQLSTQNPVKIPPFSASSAHTTWWA